MTVAFATLGCKLNQFETDSIATSLRERGYTVVDFETNADVYIVNSCTVTNRADRKSRNLLYRAERMRAHRDALIVMTGCFVESHRDELESDGRTYVVGNDNKHAIPELVDAHFNGEITHPAGSVFDFRVPDRIFHTRSTVKIQDGCDNFCTFCIIPHVRGRAASRPLADVVTAIEEAVAGGAREVVLTGVNMSRYRHEGSDFTTLVDRALELTGDFRLRISSLEPDGLTDRFVELFRHPKMAPHLHLCLQSGSERTLLAMRRQYTYAEYRGIADRLRSIDPLFNLTTDLIVGFPGEDDSDHAASLDAIGAVGFGHVHTFPYSLRSGTRAERMSDHVATKTKSVRALEIRTRAEAAKRTYRERLVGRRERMLVERIDETFGAAVARGLGEHYVPIEVGLPPNVTGRYENTFVDVTIEALAAGEDPSLLGRLV